MNFPRILEAVFAVRKETELSVSYKMIQFKIFLFQNVLFVNSARGHSLKLSGEVQAGHQEGFLH